MFLIDILKVLAYPFKAFLVCSILLRGEGTGFSTSFAFLGVGIGLTVGLTVLEAATGLYPSLNSIGGGMILSSYSCTICFTLFRGFGTGLTPLGLVLAYSILTTIGSVPIYSFYLILIYSFS